MPINNVPFFDLQNTPLTNITPFAEREAYSYQEVLEDLIQNYKRIIDTVNKVVALANDIDTRLIDLESRLRKETDDKIARAIDNLYRRLAQRGAKDMIVADPVWGRTDRTVSEVLAVLYDNVRTQARFAKGADDIGATAQALDEANWTARQWDLDPEYKTDHATR